MNGIETRRYPGHERLQVIEHQAMIKPAPEAVHHKPVFQTLSHDIEFVARYKKMPYQHLKQLKNVKYKR